MNNRACITVSQFVEWSVAAAIVASVQASVASVAAAAAAASVAAAATLAAIASFSRGGWWGCGRRSHPTEQADEQERCSYFGATVVTEKREPSIHVLHVHYAPGLHHHHRAEAHGLQKLVPSRAAWRPRSGRGLKRSYQQGILPLLLPPNPDLI